MGDVPVRYFHGTCARLSAGEVVHAREGGRKPGAYASTSALTASMFGPNVYRVSPLSDPSQLVHRPMSNAGLLAHQEVVDPAGFRVDGPASDADLAAAMQDFYEAGGTSCDSCDALDFFGEHEDGFCPDCR